MRRETDQVKARIKEIEHENRELRQTNEEPEEGQRSVCSGGARPQVPQMTAFVDKFREEFGVEPIYRVLPIAPSTYLAQKAVARDPPRALARVRRAAELKDKIQEVWSEHRKLYGARRPAIGMVLRHRVARGAERTAGWSTQAYPSLAGPVRKNRSGQDCLGSRRPGDARQAPATSTPAP
ncbi:MAG: hypothetical protein RLP08_26565 [Marinovum algicola]|uniref:hypothetical protein n=1 Tax=Alphaproteobacteria TaxID=28211 RepID=UPI0032EA90FD